MSLYQGTDLGNDCDVKSYATSNLHINRMLMFMRVVLFACITNVIRLLVLIHKNCRNNI